MYTTDEYRRLVLANLEPLPPTRAELAEASGRVLSEAIVSKHGIPLFDNSAMDGYAALRADLIGASSEHPVSLNVVQDLPAGPVQDIPIVSGTVARIMTGAPMPSGADCVVPVEDTDGGMDVVRIDACPEPSRHIRRASEDVSAGDVILEPGFRLDARQLSAAASAGYSHLLVAPQPRVAVISTGSELVQPGLPLGRGQIPESNSVLLSELAREAGSTVTMVVHVTDQNDELEAALQRCAEAADVIILSGGVSVGAYDVVKAVLSPLQGMLFTKVAMQPGKPQGSGKLADGTLVFALPGNPVSACVSFETFVRPALAALQGARDTGPHTIAAVVSTGWNSPAGREQYMPVRVSYGEDGVVRVAPVSEGGSASHYVGSLASAQGFARVAAEHKAVAAGENVDVILVKS